MASAPVAALMGSWVRVSEPPVFSAISMALWMMSSLGSKPLGVAMVTLRAEQGAGEHERVADVVAVADVGEVQAVDGAEALFEGHEVGDGLAGVLEVRERVDDGHVGVRGHLGDGVVREGAEDDDVHPALEVAGDVGDGLALAEGSVGLVDEDGVAADGVHRGLEGEARAQRGLFEEHDHLLGVERVAEVFG